MGEIAQQLGLDQTFFIEFGLFFVLFVALANIYFKPFLKLFELRHKRTVEDREAGEKLMHQAEAKFEEYKARLASEKASARKEYEGVLNQAKQEEALIIANAREQAKKITQEALDSTARQQEQLRKQLETDVENLAKTISEALLLRKE